MREIKFLEFTIIEFIDRFKFESVTYCYEPESMLQLYKQRYLHIWFIPLILSNNGHQII